MLSVVGLGEDPRAIEWLGVALITGALIILGASSATATAVNNGVRVVLPFSLAVFGLAVLASIVDPYPRAPVTARGRGAT